MIVKNAFIIWLDRLVGMLFAFLISIVLARELGAGLYAKFGYVQSLLVVLTVIGTLCLDATIPRFLSCSDRFEYFFTAVFMQKVGSSIVIVISTASMYLLKDNNFALIAFILSLSFYFKRAEIYFSYYKAKYRTAEIVPFRLVAKVISLLYLYFVSQYSSSLAALVVVFCVDTLVFRLLILIKFNSEYRREKVSPKIKYAKKIGKFCYADVVNSLILPLALGLDVILLGELGNIEEVAFYTVAVVLINASIPLINSFSESLFPKMIEMYDSGRIEDLDSMTLKFMRFSLALGIFGIVFVYIFSDKAISFIYGLEYLESALIIKILVLALPFIFVSRISYKYIYLIDGQKDNIYRIFPAVTVSLVLNFILIPEYGAIGAAISFVVFFLFSDVIGYLYTEKLRIVFNLYIKMLSFNRS